MLASDALKALPVGIKKLRAYPCFTFTTSPIWPNLATRSIRIICISISPISRRMAAELKSARVLWRGPTRVVSLLIRR